jgi:Ala-tRNA(Pro) deacylase
MRMSTPVPEAASFEDRLPSPEAREKALYSRLRELGIAWKTYDHAPVFTVEESQSLRGIVPGQHTKNLFLKDKKNGLWLVVAREDQRVDLNALAKLLGGPRFSFGSADLLVETLGVPPGSVTPFALMNDKGSRVSSVFDEKMMAAAIVNVHPLRNDRTIAISATDLLRFIRSCGESSRIVALPEVAP